MIVIHKLAAEYKDSWEILKHTSKDKIFKVFKHLFSSDLIDVEWDDQAKLVHIVLEHFHSEFGSSSEC